MDEYRVGDVVRLRSGGPAMTVAKVHDNLALVRWFWPEDSDAPSPLCHSDQFPVGALKRVS